MRRIPPDVPDPDPKKVLYVHLASDGGIFVVRGDTGEGGWITEARLIEELARFKALGGTLFYSRDDAGADPPEIVFATFQHIAGTGMPIRLLEEPHPAVTDGLEHNATSLIMASAAGATEIVADLIRRGVELEAEDDEGYTALMLAANEGRAGVVDQLLEAGADVNATDNQSSTPLMFAAQHGHAGIVQRLLEAGARVDARGDHGLTALGFAKQNRHRKTRKLLERAGATQ